MKQERQQVLLDLIRNNDIFTQDELTAALKNAGFAVTQATVSRDISELKLGKKQVAGGAVYFFPEENDAVTQVFRAGLVSVDYAGNMLVLHTLSGMAAAVAAGLDSMKLPEILGSVAGDDVVMCVIRDEASAKRLAETL